MTEKRKGIRMGSIVDIKTGKVLFGPTVKEKLQEGLKPYFREDATDSTRAQAVNTIEQVICTAIVSAARAAGEVVAKKIVGLFSGKAATEPTPPEAPAV